MTQPPDEDLIALLGLTHVSGIREAGLRATLARSLRQALEPGARALGSGCLTD